jgi:hypothetical protein
MRAQAGKWLGILILILMVITGIGGFLKVGVPAKPAAVTVAN